MRQYLDLLRDVRDNGVRTPTRAILKSTGEKIDALSVFGRQVRFDLSEGFPLVTTKRVAFGAVAHELIWFLRGWTNIAYLRDNGVGIWDAWASEDGELGPVYGQLWRRWPVPGGGELDQIAALVAGVRAVKADPQDPRGRRLVLTSWNPAMRPESAPVGCHTLAVFNVARGCLSCMVTGRSADIFLGIPFNLASYALLTHLIAHVAGLDVGDLVYATADTHLYVNHIAQVDEQLSREPRPLPRVEIAPEVTDVTLVERSQIILHDYKPYSGLRGEVAV